MSEVRDFCNADLPGLARVWSEHWTAAQSPPPISTTIIERAILSRAFFSPKDLLVATIDGRVEAWCHFSRPGDHGDEWSGMPASDVAILSAICFTHAGLKCCDDLLKAAEQRIQQEECHSILAGPMRDQQCGYVGLSPIGHGIGIPDVDVRAASLLSRHGFSPEKSFQRMVVTTAPYRPPVSREMMQFRRTTRAERSAVVPQQGRYASAMAHLDIEHHQLINHRNGDRLANVRLWLSDPEAQVMSCSEAILDLSVIETPGELTSAETFLVAALIQSMATRCVFRVETAINGEHSILKEQLSALHFENTQRGQRWTKEL
ncbi:hypothetical protein Enr13x_13640 [Stieleria neptunia]|uniref:N-acetyltransferase domain-containing protein n=1 Tax=Stieleria neptunia TaxID=2527979 RepID=A0A518HKZ5_9BACT|nr:hypothetical protein [Stieleria neptunia]QDV41521.1 hypothetical protein Enr13x_13640 [Stieleria neptunia]